MLAPASYTPLQLTLTHPKANLMNRLNAAFSTEGNRKPCPARWLALMLGLALLAAGCAKPRLPALATTGHYLPGKVVWHDLVTPDLAKVRNFYGALFGWTFDEVSGGYVLVRSGGHLVGGMAEQDSGSQASYWMPLVSVENVDQAAERVRQAGGSVHLPPFDLPGRGRISVVADPFGATFGLIRAAQGDPADHEPAVNQWLWNEVWTTDPHQAAEFYRSLAGYTEGERTVFGAPYHYLEHSGQPRVGLVEKPDPAISNTWVAYVRVDDPAEVATRAAALGGKILLAPRRDIREGTLAIIMDPSGAVLIAQKWNP
jgi:predicted enzyme related to lactoylglutathione lyase